ncbi:MAG TPA: glycosyltransferase family 4 protein [Anaerolineae bacterium]|nr:glycosyltransferase family 4 protein [Anaerolineae bacterium]
MKKSTIKICHLTSVHVPFDTRIFHKECKSLAAFGYDVHLIAGHERDEEIYGVHIHAIPAIENKVKRLINSPRAVYKKALEDTYDLYHFHDPELLPVGLLLKLRGKKVIYDVHEDYPKYIKDKYWISNKVLRKIIAFLLDKFERFSAMFFDRIIVVTPDIAKRFTGKKTSIIKNYVSLDFIDQIEPYKTDSDKFIIIYVGDLSKNRGIKEAIQAMEFIGDKAELWLLGRWGTSELRNECENLYGWRYTKFFGNKTLESTYSYIKSSDIGLHCVNINDYYLSGLPTKLFEYAACQLPTVISYSKYWEEKFGDFVLFTDPDDPEDIARCILLLINNEYLRRKMGEKARRFVEKTNNWENEKLKLYEVYKNMLEDEVS